MFRPLRHKCILLTLGVGALLYRQISINTDLVIMGNVVSETRETSESTSLHIGLEQGRVMASTSKPPDRADALKFAHIVNFLPHGLGHSDQEVTVQALMNAKHFAEAQNALGPDALVVDLLSAEFAEDFSTRVKRDTSIIKEAPNLVRHAYEQYNLKRFSQIKFRKLPFIADILQSAVEASDATYIIYSNADIGVQPSFYVDVAKFLRRGYTALAINRVEIPNDDAHNSQLGAKDMEEIYALGRKHEQKHPGYDCLVFHRNVVPFLQLFLRGVFLAYPPIGGRISDGLHCTSKNYYIIRGQHLTFHLGVKNGAWDDNSEYEFYNRKAAKQAESDFFTLIQSGHGSRNPCSIVKDALMDPSEKLASRIRQELKTNSFVFPKYDKLPEWEQALVAPRCKDPQSARPDSQVKNLIIASSGRVGSTMLAKVLKVNFGIQSDHSHLSAQDIIARQRKDNTALPVLYIFGDPVDVVLSLRQRDLDTGDSYFGKNFSWVRKHLQNMGQEHLFEAWNKQEYFTKDVLQLAQQFDEWHREMPFPFMTLRYETESLHLKELEAFLGISKNIKIPDWGPGLGSRGKTPRIHRFKQLSTFQQDAMLKTYGNLRERIANAPDACIWKQVL